MCAFFKHRGGLSDDLNCALCAQEQLKEQAEI